MTEPSGLKQAVSWFQGTRPRFQVRTFWRCWSWFITEENTALFDLICLQGTPLGNQTTVSRILIHSITVFCWTKERHFASKQANRAVENHKFFKGKLEKHDRNITWSSPRIGGSPSHHAFQYQVMVIRDLGMTKGPMTKRKPPYITHISTVNGI